MGYLSSKEHILEPSRSRLAFLLLGIAAFALTELGRFVYRPYVRLNNVSDFGLADSVGNLVGIGAQIFLGLAVLNPTRKQSYRLAVFFALGYILYEFAQPYLPKGVFDWKDVYATVIGFLVSVLMIAAVWRLVGPRLSQRNRDGRRQGPIMSEEIGGAPVVGRLGRDASTLFHFAGARYWTASLLPALAGTTLPFWLRPPGFSFRWLGAAEFLVATLLLHGGFSFLHAWFADRSNLGERGTRLLGFAAAYIVAACLLGLHLARLFPGSIFIVYGVTTLFAAALYVLPPVRFFRRLGGEIVLWESLGMLPMLGAYLVQTGDLTRTVYLASLPLVVATALWVWMDELVTRMADERQGRRTMVGLFGAPFSGRVVTLALSVMLYALLFGAVFTRSISPWALAAVATAGLAWKILTVSWKHYAEPTRMIEARRKAFTLHLATSIVIAGSSLL